VQRLSDAVAAQPAFALAPMSPLVTITGTLVGALALAEGAVDADALWNAAHVDEDWQAEQWGEDSLATQTRAYHRRDFDAAVRFLSLL
jgi:chaperone required for assembly of F1-ATPase